MVRALHIPFDLLCWSASLPPTWRGATHHFDVWVIFGHNLPLAGDGHMVIWLIAVKILPVNKMAADNNRFLGGFLFTPGWESYFTVWLLLQVKTETTGQ